MVQACGRARPGRDISWPQRGDTYFPHLLGEPDRIPAGAHLERERADGPGAAGRHPADADGVVIPAGRKVPAPHPPLIASGVPERQVMAGGPDPDPDLDAVRTGYRSVPHPGEPRIGQAQRGLIRPGVQGPVSVDIAREVARVRRVKHPAGFEAVKESRRFSTGAHPFLVTAVPLVTQTGLPLCSRRPPLGPLHWSTRSSGCPHIQCALVRVSPPPARRGTTRFLVHQRTGNMSRASDRSPAAAAARSAVLAHPRYATTIFEGCSKR